MLTSVQLFVQNTLDELASPGLAPLKAVIAPPVYDDLFVKPIAYIWGGEIEYEQVTIAGPPQAAIGISGPWREFRWRVDIWVKNAIKNTDPQINTNFPGLVDSVIKKLNSVRMAQQIADPVTNEKTWVVSMHHGRGNYGNLHAAQKDQRLWIAEFHLSLELKEWVQQ